MSGRQTIMLAVGLAMLTILGVAALIYPEIRMAALARAETTGFKAELAKPNAGPDTIQLLRERLDLLERVGDDRITPIPDQPDLAGLMRRMSAMFEESGIEPPQLTTGVPQPDNGAMSMPMTVVATGNFVAITEAVRSIESLPRLVRVRRVRLSTESNTRRGPIDRDAIVRADLLLDVFYGTAELAEVDD